MSQNPQTVRKTLRRFIEKAGKVSDAASKCLNPRSRFFGMSLTETLRGETASKKPTHQLFAEIIDSTAAENAQDLKRGEKAALRETLLHSIYEGRYLVPYTDRNGDPKVYLSDAKISSVHIRSLKGSKPVS